MTILFFGSHSSNINVETVNLCLQNVVMSCVSDFDGWRVVGSSCTGVRAQRTHRMMQYYAIILQF